LTGKTQDTSSSSPTDPDSLEVAPGTVREKLEGWIPTVANSEELLAALEHAFDYRGDVSITRKDVTQLEGYVFDRRTAATLAESYVRVLPKDGSSKLTVRYDDIAALAFTGRDMAAGKSFESWVRHYWEKKAAGEKNISLQPEKLE